jgi:hypothetical protein
MDRMDTMDGMDGIKASGRFMKGVGLAENTEQWKMGL